MPQRGPGIPGAVRKCVTARHRRTRSRPQALADSLARERRYLDDLLGLARAPLDADAKLTYDIFRRERELAIESFTYPTELLPVNPFDSMPQRFALMAAAAERQALASDRDVDVWQSRALAYERWTNQALLNLREGMRRGYTLPLAVVSRTLPVLAALGEDTPDGVFSLPLRAAAGAADDAGRARRADAVRRVVREKILPNYVRLHDFLQREYLPRARNNGGTVGPAAGPGLVCLSGEAGDGRRADRGRAACPGRGGG